MFPNVVDSVWGPIPVQQYMVTCDLGGTADFRDHLTALIYSGSYMTLDDWTTNPANTTNQVIIIEKPRPFDLAGPSDDQIQLGIDKKYSLWIPGKYLGNRGYDHLQRGQL